MHTDTRLGTTCAVIFDKVRPHKSSTRSLPVFDLVNRRALQIGLASAALVLVTACGGGSDSGASTIQPPVTPQPPPVTVPPLPVTYLMTATANTGGTIAPARVTADKGQQVTFAVTPSSHYAIRSVSGCAGTLNGSSYITAPADGSCEVHATFEAIPVVKTYTVSVEADSHVVITQAIREVPAGSVANIVATPQADYPWIFASGCGGALTGNTFTTGPVNAPCSVYIQARPRTVRPSLSSYSLNDLSISPNAVFSDELATTPLTVEVKASNAAGLNLFIEYFFNWTDKSQPQGLTKVPLYDDGSHGDRVPGDSIYTGTFTVGSKIRLRYYEDSMDSIRMWPAAYDDAGVTKFSNSSVIPNLNLGVIDPKYRTTTTQISSDVFATSNMVNIVSPGFTSADNYLADAMKKVYKYYPDVFDGFSIHPLGVGVPGNIPLGFAIKNIVSGINQSIFDTSWTYGSAGVLHNGVLQSHDILGESFLHEFGHSYAFFLSNPALDLTSNGGIGMHLGSPTTVLGQMGGDLYLSEQPNGDFVVTTTQDFPVYHSRQFANLELYLMGLMPPENVAPEYFVLNSNVKTSISAVIPKTSATRVTIDDIVKVYGPRNPSFATSQKSFRFVYIALTERPATPAEIAIINRVAAYMESSAIGGEMDDQGLFTINVPRTFRSATKGMGTLITTLPPRR